MQYNKMIDHTLLKPDATTAMVDQLIQEAINYQFKSICINPCFVTYAKQKLVYTGVLVCTVVGFPLGANTTQSKVLETSEAIGNGADEIDMVINFSAFKNHDYNAVLQEIQAVKQTCGKKVLKVIVETALLNQEELMKISALVASSGADFIKTSTGFGSRGASFADIETIKKVVQNQIQIKAAGGIQSYADLTTMHQLGATRFGLSRSVMIMEQAKQQ